MQDSIRKLRSIATDATLSPAQKRHYLSLEAENMLPYPTLDAETQEALEQRVICDMHEGNAPYKPRYVTRRTNRAMSCPTTASSSPRAASTWSCRFPRHWTKPLTR
jgi:hypothetical protein